MAFLLDTSVAVELQDSEPRVTSKLADLDGPILLSIITRVELEGGVYRDTVEADVRRARLDVLLDLLPVLAFDAAAAQAYGNIVRAAGYSRRKVVDRMIAAQALVHPATLVTLNPADFKDVPGLKLLAW